MNPNAMAFALILKQRQEEANGNRWLSNGIAPQPGIASSVCGGGVQRQNNGHNTYSHIGPYRSSSQSYPAENNNYNNFNIDTQHIQPSLPVAGGHLYQPSNIVHQPPPFPPPPMQQQQQHHHHQQQQQQQQYHHPYHHEQQQQQQQQQQHHPFPFTANSVNNYGATSYLQGPQNSSLSYGGQPSAKPTLVPPKPPPKPPSNPPHNMASQVYTSATAAFNTHNSLYTYQPSSTMLPKHQHPYPQPSPPPAVSMGRPHPHIYSQGLQKQQQQQQQQQQKTWNKYGPEGRSIAGGDSHHDSIGGKQFGPTLPVSSLTKQGATKRKLNDEKISSNPSLLTALAATAAAVSVSSSSSSSSSSSCSASVLVTAAGGTAQDQHSSAAAPVSVPEPQMLYCEPCDKEFQSTTAYDAHRQTHEVCTHPGCTFSASKKVVIAHYHGAHGLYSGSGLKTIDVEGQKFKVLMGTNEEEVNQWRAERKKKFPTAQNVKEKEESRAALEGSGGVVPKLKKRKVSGAEDVSKDEEDCDEGVSSSSSLKKKRCIYFGRGMCKAKEGDCKYNHDFTPVVCQFFVGGKCRKASKCPNIHDRELRKQRLEKEKEEKQEESMPKPPLFNSVGEIVPAPVPFLVPGQDDLGKEDNISAYSDNVPVADIELKDTSMSGPDNGDALVSGEDNNNDNVDEDVSEGGEKAAKRQRTEEGYAGSSSSTSKSAYNKSDNSTSLNVSSHEHHSNTNKNKNSKNNKNNKNGRGSLNDIPKPLDGGVRGTLLRNLLKDQILEEENLLLQVMRFIRENNYLQPVQVHVQDNPDERFVQERYESGLKETSGATAATAAAANADDGPTISSSND